MKYVSLDKSREKSSVAWFKLAEVITRGEKERALSIYRLLMHSISDNALKAQLEGDILRIFGDPAAVYSYERAAQLYQQNNETMHAALLYEWMVALLILQPDFFQAYALIRDSHLDAAYKRARYEQLIVGMLTTQEGCDAALLRQLITVNLKSYKNDTGIHSENKMARFLAKLAALDEKSYAYAAEQALIL